MQRLNKFIASTGFCSRRKADEYIENGDVVVNGSIMLIPSIVSMLTKIIAGIAAICLQNYY